MTDQHTGISEEAWNAEVITNDPTALRAFSLKGRVKWDDLIFSGFASSPIRLGPARSYDASLFEESGRVHTLQDPGEYRAYVDLQYARSIGEDAQLTSRTFYDKLAFNGRAPNFQDSLETLPGSVLVGNDSFGEWVGSQWQLTSRWSNRHKIQAGIEYRENLRPQAYQSSDVLDLRFLPTRDDWQQRNARLIAQSELVLPTDLRLNAGVRYDHSFSGEGGALNPTLALTYKLQDQTTIKARYEESIVAPSAYAIRSYQLTVDRSVDPHHRLNVSAYRYNVAELTGSAIAPGSVEASGIELEVKANYEDGPRATLSYARQLSRELTGAIALSPTPRHLARLNIGIPLWADRLATGFELQYHGAVETGDGTSAGDFLISNLTLGKGEASEGADISLGVYNLFDVQLDSNGADAYLRNLIVQDGRAIRMNVTYGF